MPRASRRSGLIEARLPLLGVRPDETQLVGWLSATFFVTQTTHGLGLNVADALFFLRFGVEHLPLMILVSGGVVMLAMLAYTASLSSFGDRRWLWLVPMLSAGWLLVERAGIAADAGGIYPVVWQAAQVIMMVTFTLMWTAAAEVCTTRQAKRLYPLFASAGIAGGILGNAVTGPLAGLLGTENLLLVQAGLLAGSAVLVRATATRFFDPATSEAGANAMGDLTEGFRLTLETPLLRLVALTALASSLLLFLVVFPFSEIVAGSFPTESGVATYLGVFSALATAATLAVSLFVANRLFSNLGVVMTLLVMPVTYLVGFALWVVQFDLVTASIVRGVQWVALNALGATALNSLFNVVRGRRRAQVIAFVNAIPIQVGTAVAGALLLAAGQASTTARLSLSLAVAGSAVVVVLRMRGAYVDALVSAVDRGLVDVFTATVPGLQKPDLDADSRAALRTGLDHPDPARRRVTIAMAARLEDETADALLESQLDDDHPSVRLAALDALLESGDRHATTAVRMLDDADREVRLRAARYLTGLEDTPASAAIDGLLSDPDAELRGVGAVLVGGARGIATVSTLLADADPAAVRSGLEAVAHGVAWSGTDIHPLAEHPDPGVRQAAARALAEGDNPDDALVSLLDDVSPAVRNTAAETLANRPNGPDLLHSVLATGSVRASEAALTVLASSGGDYAFDTWIDGELDRATFLHHMRAALGHEEDPDAPAACRYLIRVLTARQRRLERWILEALGAADGMPPLDTVTRGAWSEDPETRSQALEALESIAHREHARRLIALIEDELAEGAPEPREALWDLSGDFDSWLRALAVRCLDEEIEADLARLSEVTEQDDVDLVRSAITPTDVVTPDSPRELGVLDKVLALQHVDLLSRLDPEELQLVADVTDERFYDAGSTIFEVGAPGSEMLVIVEGRCEVRSGSSAEPVIRGPGEYVGELAILRGRPRMASVVAGPDGAHALVVPGSDLRSILEERPEPTLSMLRTLAERIIEASPSG